MKKPLILDCTIRDGGIVNDFNFDINFVKKCMDTIEKSDCNYCELGYIHDKKYINSYDTFWKNINIVELSSMLKKSNIKLSVMGDMGKFSLDLIPEKTSNIVVDLIRVAGTEDKLLGMLDLTKKISSKGYETSINLMASSHYSKDDWERIVDIVNKSSFKPTFIYFADSFGNLKPSDVLSIVNKLKKLNDVKIGFHSHNQLQLAFANTLKAIELDIDIVDSTITGMGKGPGNLPTELLLGYYNHDLKYVNKFIDNEMKSLMNKYEWGYLHKYFICGLYNATPRYGEFIMRDKNSSLNDVVDSVKNKSLGDKISYKKDISNVRITAVIPIKMNNERLPGKNTNNLGDKPLCQYIFNTLLKVKERYKNLDIIVYCSSDEIKQYLLPGIKFLKRDKRLDENNTNYTDIFSEFIKEADSDIYIYTHATSPFIKADSIINSIKKVLIEGYDSSFSVLKKNVFYWADDKSNYNTNNVPRTQDLDPIFIETSGFYVYRKDVFENTGTRIGKTPFLYCVDEEEGIDIDDKKDFVLAQNIICSVK